MWKKKYKCCQKLNDSIGCKNRYPCCKQDEGNIGCQDVCCVCKMEWGTGKPGCGKPNS